MLSFYKWFIGSQNDLTGQFQNNEQLFYQARNFWNNLETITVPIVIVMLVVGIGMAVYYYTIFNNKPGRHYRPVWWLIFMGVALIVTLVVSLSIEIGLCAPKLHGTLVLEIMLALGNALYACIAYLVMSVVWCNLLPTNAYRLLKFKKR